MDCGARKPVDLAWSSTDLYGLVFMRLGNAGEEGGFAAEFRRATAQGPAPRWQEREGVHLLPPAFARDPGLQKPVIEEIAEDYPWVKPLLEAARGAVVPITADELSKRWDSECLGRMQRAAAERNKLPPRRFSSDPFRRDSPEALLDDLVELAVLYRTKDNRLNIPDIFRVGFGIRRRGGVKPPR